MELELVKAMAAIRRKSKKMTEWLKTAEHTLDRELITRIHNELQNINTPD